MQGRNTTRHLCYLNKSRPEDRELLSKLRADRVHGLSTSEVLRRALSVYYGLTPPPPPTPPPSAPLAALTDAVQQLTREVQSMRAELDTLRRQVAESHHAALLAADSAELRLALAASSVLAKPERAKVARAAAEYLGVMTGSGGNGHNGNGNG